VIIGVKVFKISVLLMGSFCGLRKDNPDRSSRDVAVQLPGYVLNGKNLENFPKYLENSKNF
jgi:hypothetical protein